MAKKDFSFKGLTFEDVKKLSLTDFCRLLPSRQRRHIMKRGWTEQEKILMENLKKSPKGVKTHCREMIILPEMVGAAIKVYNGKEFVQVNIEKEMLGHCLGEFSFTRKRVAHSAPGIGATKSSASVAVK